MKKNSVIQFVGFVTSLDFPEFVPQWEGFTKQFMKVPGARIMRRKSEARGGFKYISFHEVADSGFQFNFMKGRTSEHFPEHRVKVVQAGGYMAVDLVANSPAPAGGNKILAFLSHDEYDLSAYHSLAGFKHLTVYEAYFENCLYGHILEYVTSPSHAESLLEQLKERPGCDAALYADCSLPKSRTSVTKEHATVR